MTVVGVKCTHISAERRGLSLRVRTLRRDKYRLVFGRGVSNITSGHPRLRGYLSRLHGNSILIMCGLSQLNQSLQDVL